MKLLYALAVAIGLTIVACLLGATSKSEKTAVFCANSNRITVMAEVDSAYAEGNTIHWKENGKWWFYQKSADEACMTLEKLPTIPEVPPVQEKQGLNVGSKEEG